MTRPKFFILFLVAIIFTECGQKTGNVHWEITTGEYLETPGFNLLVFHNNYPVGDQGGIEFIHHGERIATNGYIQVQMPPGSPRFPRPETAERSVDPVKMEIQAKVSVADFDFTYTIRIWPENNTLHLAVDLDQPIPATWEGKATFDLQLFPVTYQGKTYHLGEQFGVIPVEGMGPMATLPEGGTTSVPLASGPKLILAPEDPLCKIQIEHLNGNLALVDDRNSSLGGWILVRTLIPGGKDKGAVEWVITPNILPEWRRAPVITYSQVGYHPDQVKQAIIEMDARSTDEKFAILYRIGNDGKIHEVISGKPQLWGNFLRYKYSIYDFSEIKTPGLYRIAYGTKITEPFRISADVYQQRVWQPTLEIYFPVQMCHMRIRDRVRVWHGACHLDDALQAPVSTEHVDGYRTYASTETNFKPFTPVPGLNRGGWHDAGDNDLAAGSQAQTVLYLALAGEEFGIDVDQTTVKQDELFVELRRPDGIPDLQQQIEHGVINLLTGYRISGHSYVGIIETREGRAFLGDVASVTDQLFYDASLKSDEVRGNRSGKPDDRWVVTNKDTSLEYEVITALVAASRILRGYNDDLAHECLQTAIKAWNYEQTHEPVNQPNAYVPRYPERQEILATAELLLTTGEDKYKNRLIALLPVIQENIREVGWSVSRTLDKIKEESFNSGVTEALKSYKSRLDKDLSENPYGVPWRPRIWGIGWDIQDYAAGQYYLAKVFPDLFDREYVCRVVNYVLGCHPGSSTSLVSAVGTHSIIPAYGFNMHWWSYIPGGMVSGTALIRPDLPEMKEPYPYIWQQTEYVMPGASTYIFCVLAADKLLNDKKSD